MSRQLLTQTKTGQKTTDVVTSGLLPAKNKLLLRPVEQSETLTVPPIAQNVLRSPGQPLDTATRGFMEPRFGHDFSQVRVHADATAEESAKEINATAYTVGRDIVLGRDTLLASAADHRKIIAHELTHVVQQDRGYGQPAAYEQAEREAENNSFRVNKGRLARVEMGMKAGSLQRQDKEKAKGGGELERGFEIKPKEEEGKRILNKFTFTADITAPLASGLRLGPIHFLDKLKLETKGSTESAEQIPLQETEISSLQTKLALDLARLEIEKVKLPASLGTLSMDTKIGTSGSLTLSFGDILKLKKGSLATTGSLEAGYTSPSLLSPRAGELTIGAKLSAGGALTKTFGEESKFLPKLEGKAGLEASYTSPYLRSPALTLGGLLGERARISAGVEGGYGVEYGSEKGVSSKLSAGGSLGVSGTREKGGETFVKLKVTGEAEFDPSSRKINAKSESYFIGLMAGAKF